MQHMMQRDTLARTLRTHVVAGPVDQVRAVLARAASDGRLAGVRDAVELSDRRVQVTADLWEPVDRGRSPARSYRRWLRPVLIGLVAALVAGGLVWLLVLAVMAAVAWVSAHLALIVVSGLALAALAVPVGKRCVGMHCGGCRG